MIASLVIANSCNAVTAKNIILVIDESEHHSDEDLDILLFTSITRAKESLVVLNRLERYEEYGTGWPGGWHSH